MLQLIIYKCSAGFQVLVTNSNIGLKVNTLSIFLSTQWKTIKHQAFSQWYDGWKRPGWRCLMVSNDANYPKMTQITAEGKEGDSIPIPRQLVGNEEKSF